MIVAEPTGRRWKPDEETEQMAPQLSGLMVIVVVAGRYNGPNHKSLGDCEAGQQIVISPGPYAEYLLEQGLVRLPGEELEAVGEPLDSPNWNSDDLATLEGRGFSRINDPRIDPEPADAPTLDVVDDDEPAPKRRGRKKA